MELEFIYRLAHQLDKDTFFEVYSLLDNTIEEGNIPERHVRKAAEILGIDNKTATELNFRKEYKGSNTNSIKLLEKRRIELGLGKKDFSELLGCDLVTYRNWRKAGRIPEKRLKAISEATKINFDLLVESNFADS